MFSPKIIKKSFLSVLALCISPMVFAGPPYLTDDPVPTDYKHFELYPAIIIDRSNNDNNITTPTVELDYGLVPNVEINITGSITANLSRVSGVPSAVGLGDTQLGSTLRFIQETDYCPQVAFSPAITFPTGDQNRGLGNGRPWEMFPFWAEKSWGKWTLDTGGGYVHNIAPTMDNYFFGGVLLQRQITEKFTPGAEIFTQGSASDDEKATTILNAGGTYDFTDSFSFLFSAGHSIAGANNLVSYIGLYWTW